MKAIASLEFIQHLVMEHSSGPTVTSLGQHFHRMELKVDGENGVIIWNYGKKAADEMKQL